MDDNMNQNSFGAQNPDATEVSGTASGPVSATQDIYSQKPNEYMPQSAFAFSPQSSYTPQADLSQQNTFTPQTDFAQQSAFAPQTDLAQQSAFAPQTDLTQQNTFAPQADLAQQSAFAQQTDLTKQSAFAPQADLAQQGAFAPQADLAQQSAFATQTNFAQQNPYSSAALPTPQPPIMASQGYTPQNNSQPAYHLQDLENPISMGDWMVTILLTFIPCVNLIMLFVWAFGNNEPKSKSNWAKAYLIWIGIYTALVVVLYIFIFASIFSSSGLFH